MELEKRKLSKEEMSMVTSIALNDPNLNQILKESRYEVEGCWASLKYESPNVTKISIIAYSDIDKANISDSKFKEVIYPCVNIYITHPVKSKLTVIVDLLEKKTIKVVGIPLKP